MKVKTALVNNVHSVVVSNDTEERLFHSFEHGAHIAAESAQALLRDISNHGDLVVQFDSLPVVKTRVNGRGNTVRFTN